MPRFFKTGEMARVTNANVLTRLPLPAALNSYYTIARSNVPLSSVLCPLFIDRPSVLSPDDYRPLLWIHWTGCSSDVLINILVSLGFLLTLSSFLCRMPRGMLTTRS